MSGDDSRATGGAKAPAKFTAPDVVSAPSGFVFDRNVPHAAEASVGERFSLVFFPNMGCMIRLLIKL